MSQTRLATLAASSTGRERMVEILIEKSFLSSAEPRFPLASGQLSKYYIDCKRALSYPEFREIVGDLISQLLSNTTVDAVGGLALGAYPIAVAVSDAFYRRTQKTVRAFVVRKDPKSHGLKKHIEGDICPGDRVLIVDDVITSGKSTIEAISKAQDEGLIVVAVVALIDRKEQNGSSAIRACGVPFTALLTLDDLVNSSPKQQ